MGATPVSKSARGLPTKIGNALPIENNQRKGLLGHSSGPMSRVAYARKRRTTTSTPARGPPTQQCVPSGARRAGRAVASREGRGEPGGPWRAGGPWRRRPTHLCFEDGVCSSRAGVCLGDGCSARSRAAKLRMRAATGRVRRSRAERASARTSAHASGAVPQRAHPTGFLPVLRRQTAADDGWKRTSDINRVS